MVVTKVGDRSSVYVGGEVARPGVVMLQPGMTPLQAVMQTGGFRPTAKLDSVLLITPAADGQFSASRVNMEQVVEEGVPERVRLRANEVVYVPKTWVGDMNEVVDLYVRGLIPALPRVGVGYSLEQPRTSGDIFEGRPWQPSRPFPMRRPCSLPGARAPRRRSRCAASCTRSSSTGRLVLGVFSAVFLGSAVAAFLRPSDVAREQQGAGEAGRDGAARARRGAVALGRHAAEPGGGEDRGRDREEPRGRSPRR